jgi:hypothetical protein
MAARKISEKDHIIWQILADPNYRVCRRLGKVFTRVRPGGSIAKEWRRAGRMSVSRGGLKRYWRIKYKGQEVYEGRVIFAARHGHLDPFKVVDHPNHDGTDNGQPLRQLTVAENALTAFEFYRQRGLGPRQARQKWISSMEGESNAAN